MEFELDKAVEVLRATPAVLDTFLSGLSDEWTMSSGDQDRWEAYDVIGHLINGEQTDWIPRAEVILSENELNEFEPFDRFAQFELSRGKTLKQLLDEFADERKRSLETLLGWELRDQDLDRTAIHPELGSVTLRQLISTWVVHDLTHIRQIATALARKYSSEVGPWREYLSILK